MVTASGKGQLSLSAGPLSLVLSPDVGGSIARFDFVGGDRLFEILRGCAGESEDVLAMGSFPLVPYVNRIRDGAFAFRGKDVRLAPNMAGDPSPLHGQGWLMPWQVVEADSTNAMLRLEHDAGEWPWSYAAEQHFTLHPDGLELSLRCTNHSPDAMPCGLGQHPYFHCGPETRIDTTVSHVWLIDDQVLPTDKVPAEGRFDLRDTKVCGLGLDHGFAGWSGSTRLSDPSWPVAVVMHSPDAGFFQLYSPRDGGIFVAEPVTHANAALNLPERDWNGAGMRILEPGETMAMTMNVTIS